MNTQTAQDSNKNQPPGTGELKKHRWFGIKVKILTFFVALILLASIANLLAIKSLLTKDLTNEFLGRAITSSEGLRARLTDIVLTGDHDKLVELISDEKYARKDVAYIAVFDSGNQLVATTLIKEDLISTIKTDSAANGNKEQVKTISTSEGDIFDVSLSIPYNKGIVRVGYYKEQIDKSINNVLLLILAIMSASLIIAMILVSYLTGIILNPIANLRNTVSRLAGGEMKIKSNIRNRDEVGDLAQTFNQMVDKINDYYTQLQVKAEDASNKAKQLEAQNESLQNTEKAMLNILEDARDLEEQLKAEKTNVENKIVERTQELSEEHSKLQASLESMNVGFFLVNPDLEIEMINSSAKHILCSVDKSGGFFTKADIIQVKCTMADIEKRMEGIFNFKAEVQKCINEQRLSDIEGLELKNRFLHIFIAPIVTLVEKSIRVIGAVVLVEDITEAKLLERSKDEFFSIASHELRTPLTAIRGNTALIEQMYMDKINDKDFSEMISDIHESSKRLIEIVNDFLSMSRLELGKMKFNIESFDISQLIHEVIAEYQTTGSIKMLSLTFNDPGFAVPKVVADRNRTKEVLINLVGNAIKFTDKGGVTIDVTQNNNLIKVRVTDTGKGISESGKNILFKKFQQAADSIYTRNATQGTGLGLYISRLMVEKMEGEIGLERSELEKGSTFFFTLPIATAGEIEVSKAASETINLEPMTKTKIRLAQGEI